MAGPGPGSGLTLKQLRSRVKDQATFAEDDAVINEWINEKHKQGAVRAQLDKRIVTLGTTVAGQTDYDFDAQISDLRSLKVGSAHYQQVGTETLWDLQEGNRAINPGIRGVFAAQFKSDGTPQISVFPAPASSGDEIKALAVFTPADLTDDNAYPLWPEDEQEHIASGAIGLGRRLRDEDDQQADAWETRFEASIERMRRRQNSRIGGGTTRLQIVR